MTFAVRGATPSGVSRIVREMDAAALARGANFAAGNLTTRPGANFAKQLLSSCAQRVRRTALRAAP